MKLSHHLINALCGWSAGLLSTLLFSFLWQQIIPVVDRTGRGASLMPVILLILLVLTPITIAGGVIGGRVPREGGTGQMLIYAIFFGILFAIPFSCFLFWYTGW